MYIIKMMQNQSNTLIVAWGFALFDMYVLMKVLY